MQNNNTDLKPLSVLFFGPSGAGKGTQAQLLREYLQQVSNREVAQIDMGLKLREVVQEGRYAGRKINSIISKGEFLPGTIPVYFMYDYLMQNFRPENHLVADGVVRTAVQAQAFHEAMYFFEHTDYKVIFLELSDNTIKGRLLARGRGDDTESGIQKRINEYKEKVLPLVNVFESFGKDVLKIDGEPTVEEVHESVKQALNI